MNFAKTCRSERKGITRSVALNGHELTGWDVFTLPMTDVASGSARRRAGPGVLSRAVRGDAGGDTFLDLRGWGKGAVWVNGHHLGRFW